MPSLEILQVDILYNTTKKHIMVQMPNARYPFHISSTVPHKAVGEVSKTGNL